MWKYPALTCFCAIFLREYPSTCTAIHTTPPPLWCHAGNVGMAAVAVLDSRGDSWRRPGNGFVQHRRQTAATAQTHVMCGTISKHNNWSTTVRAITVMTAYAQVMRIDGRHDYAYC